MKIAMVSEHASPLATLGGIDAGGQNVHVAALASGLARRGHEVTVFTRRDAVGLPERVRAKSGYVVEHVPAGPPSEVPKDQLWPFMGDFASHLGERWKNEHFDVAHSHFWMSGAATMRAAADTGTPWAHTFHALGTVKNRYQGANDTSPIERIAVEASICKRAGVVIATCRDEIAELTKLLGRAPKRAVVIPCGVDTDLFIPFRPRPRTAAPRILAVGRLVERKGIADTIEAVGRLPEVELLVAGGPAREALSLDPEFERLQGVARTAGCADRVRFLGGMPRQRMPAIFAAADLVAATPWYEPFGIVPLEAMACARPVVGSAVGGLLDTIEAGVTGELLAPHDPEGLATVFDALLSDRARRIRYGRAGAERVRRRFSWNTVVAQTERTLASLLRANVSLEVSP